MLKAHGDAKTFEIGQVRLNIEGITWDWGFQASANTIKHLSLKKNCSIGDVFGCPSDHLSPISIQVKRNSFW